MFHVLFAQVGLSVDAGAIGGLAIVLSFAVGACVFGGLGLISVFSRPPRAVEGLVLGGMGVAMWCGEIAAANELGLAWNLATILVHLACGVVAILPLFIGGRIISSRKVPR
jgi:hypothetical protein